MKVRKFGQNHVIKCPGCDVTHVIDTRWDFNGDMDKPTFKPSLLVQYEWGDENEERRCHSFITDGNIRYLNDCTHELVGQTVELPEITRGDSDE